MKRTLKKIGFLLAVAFGGLTQPACGEWLLHGTLAMGEGRGRAILKEEQGGQQESYKVGEELPNGGILQRIDARSVEIEQNGRTLLLSLGDTLPARLEDALPGHIPQTIRMDRKDITRYADDLPALTRELRIAPILHQDQVTAYRISHLAKGGIGDRLGLMANDVVTAVNGIELSEVKDAMGLYQQLNEEPRLTVDLIRNGQTMTLELDLSGS